MKLWAGLIFILLAFSHSGATQKPDVIAQEVSYCDLIKAPQQFAGKRIGVRAIYKDGFEVQRLDPPTCCLEHGAKIWVEIADLQGGSLRLYRRFPKGMGLSLATFEGIFEAGGPYGDGGYRLKLIIDKIEKLEATAKISTRHEPAWVPKDCELARLHLQGN
jgi:hypothetical protein